MLVNNFVRKCKPLFDYLSPMFVSVRSIISEHPRRMRVSFTEYLFMHCIQSVNNVCVI